MGYAFFGIATPQYGQECFLFNLRVSESEASQLAHQLPPEELKGLVAQVSGADQQMISKICGTLNGLLKLADFTPELTKDPAGGNEEPEPAPAPEPPSPGASLRPEFHYKIQVHLPTNSTEETYLNIFNAIRKAFK